MNSSAPKAAALAAHRARTIATIARRSADSTAPIPLHAHRIALLTIAGHLDIAAHSFETEPPSVIGGVTVSNESPVGARLALADAEREAVANPGTGFPPQFGQYVTQPLCGNDVSLPPSFLPSRPAQIAEEADLLGRLLAVHAALPFINVEEVTDALLVAAFTLHWKHAQLADVIRADSARPYNQATAIVEIPTPATPMALRRAHDEHGPTLRFSIDRALPCHVSDQGRTHNADRMVSHRGSTIASCPQHQEHAAEEAKGLYNLLG
ncbi:hypothetical protein ACWDG9_16830 [Streptomyces sp. NPDC001073]